MRVSPGYIASCRYEPDYKLIIRVKGKVVRSDPDAPPYRNYYDFSAYYTCADSLDPSHALAFAMATHTRLGDLSGLAGMSDDLLNKILEVRKGMQGPIIGAESWEAVKQLAGCAGWSCMDDGGELMDIVRTIARQRASELGAVSDRAAENHKAALTQYYENFSPLLTPPRPKAPKPTPRLEDEEALLKVYVDVMKMTKNLGAYLPEEEYLLAVEIADMLIARQAFEPAAKHLGDLLESCGLERVDDYSPTMVGISVGISGRS